MAEVGYQLVLFLIFAHAMLWQGQYGDVALIDKQTGENPHKDFVDHFLSGDVSETVQVDDSSNVVSSAVGLGLKALDWIGLMAGILASPYTLIAGSGLPTLIVVMFQAGVGYLESAVVASFFRGKDF